MDTSVSPQLDGSLNGSMTDGEENHSDDSLSPAALPQVSAESQGVTVVQLCDGQTVIQTPQTSVIQSPHVQTVQIASVAELEDDESVTDTQKRRVLLSRRPSYRKILNELSSDSPAVPIINEERAEDEEDEEDEEEEEEEEEVPVSSAASATVPTSIYQTSSGQYIAITHGGAMQLTSPGVEAFHGAQTTTVASSHVPQPGATILQCADSTQQFYIQGGQVLVQVTTSSQALVAQDLPPFQKSVRVPTVKLRCFHQCCLSVPLR
ncbi:cAMP-responsive element modulator isoform X2 [Anarrhichthys ocellatus]|uniref:cAMP-responsive element modulator isoform X2 n=1 Tax=Anarrhichthys ocellatus TaxID=433405 RepID=UPI0012EE67FB|nr:cAMP-responsive element modulator-like isoform X2 [Anarrhichthys ocellatus]